MAINRYGSRKRLINFNKSYIKHFFKDRGVGKIKQYDTAVFYYPSDEEMQNLAIDEHVWSLGDKYYKLASVYYGDPQYWWVIAFFNKKPADFLLNIGDVVYIPQPLEEIINYIGV
jgi:nucleoid-associated protein YgaU